MLKNIKLLDMIAEQMRWHHKRHGVLAENIAHADTPGYSSRELARPEFEKFEPFSIAAMDGSEKTHPRHIPVGVFPGGRNFALEKSDNFETTPDGNTVVIEEQMMKLTDNQMRYQTAASLYSRGLGLLKMATGRR